MKKTALLTHTSLLEKHSRSDARSPDITLYQPTINARHTRSTGTSRYNLIENPTPARNTDFVVHQITFTRAPIRQTGTRVERKQTNNSMQRTFRKTPVFRQGHTAADLLTQKLIANHRMYYM